MDKNKRIGLFPIKNVLFPETVLPVHIFEKRYISLINSAIANEIDFGLTLKDKGKIYEIGCVCKVADILKKYKDGRLDVLLEGQEKFKISKKVVGSVGYYEADIIFLKDINDNIDYELLAKCVNLYNELIDHLKNLKIKKIGINNLNYKNPSYYIAQKSGLSLTQRYQLLSLNSENKRLDFIYAHLKNIFPIIKEAELVSKIIRNDGYYNPK